MGVSAELVVQGIARWTCAGGVHRFDLFLTPLGGDGAHSALRGTWTAVDDDELRAMLSWLLMAGIAVEPTGATAATVPQWPDGMGPAPAGTDGAGA